MSCNYKTKAVKPRSAFGQSTRGGVLVTASPGTALHRWLRRGRTVAALVRPDGTVQRTARDPKALRRLLPAPTPHRRT
ncbi:hypothetical protein [Streptomyces hilarionis]|uniref:hypothetical protein n=1 Tax=Streptomyces hilarionis TaxID=2839954 RepID=UPI00211A1F02|nr:hypothetical protein [Streptomyces hilarionis]MCQ9131957.1 hypothetical protein [Streptomyces hilarionis]